MKFNITDNKKFSEISGDNNKIHINKKHAKKFFIKKPIVHGVNILIKAFKKKKFLKNKFNYLEIVFKDFVNIDEKISECLNNNYLFIKGLYNSKIEIYKNFNENKLFFKQKEIIDELLFISKYVGNISPGPNSLIQQIKLIYSDTIVKKRIFKKRKINKNVIIINYFYKNLIVEVTALKLQPFQSESIIILKKRTINSIKKKKIVIYGKNSDLGIFLFNSNLKKYCKVIILSSKRLSNNTLNKDLKRIKPDFIFYFLSPKIINGKTKKLYKNYLNIYLNIPIKIFNANFKYKSKFKIFYPSTDFINQQKKYKYLKSYIDAKKKAESELRKMPYKNTFCIIRLPQLKTRSNYNPLLGKYVGKKLSYLSYKLLSFF
jgi:hypothetical protein